ncbi:hypothetical protein D3C77_637180 [compost metagenome]
MLVAALHVFTGALDPLLYTVQIGKNQFKVNRLDITDWIDFSIHVGNVLVFKAAYDVYNRIYFANVGKELVAEPFSLTRTAHKTCDINEFKRCRHRTVRHDQLR